jgi:hypothetical protein
MAWDFGAAQGRGIIEERTDFGVVVDEARTGAILSKNAEEYLPGSGNGCERDVEE